MNIEGLSLHSLAHELNQVLAGGRISKILQPTRTLFLLKIRQPDREHTLAVSVDPGDPRLHLTEEVRENPIEPSALCMLLRKQLLDGRIATVKQEKLDRVLHIFIDIRSGQGRIDTRVLTIELAGKNSNLIFVCDGIVVDALRRIGANTSRVRQIVPGIPYVPPPAPARLDPLSTPPDALLDGLRRQPALPLAKALLACMEGIGPIGTAEILFRAGLQKSEVIGSLSQEENDRLRAALASFCRDFQAVPPSAFVALDSAGRLMTACTFEPTHLKASTLQRFPSLNAALAFAATLVPAPRTTLHYDTYRRVKSELEKLERKLLLLQQELAESQQAENYRVSADLLMASLHRLQPGQQSVAVTDYFQPQPDGSLMETQIALDPSLSPMENVQRYYKKYSRAKRAQELIQVQIRQCREDISYLETIALPLTDNATQQEVQEIVQELADAGYFQPAKKNRIYSRPSEPRHVNLASGSILFIGRNNRQNDLVTFKMAQPNDLWFHTKDIPGSHVILRSNGPTQTADLEKAAQLAAWFSKARFSANVPVDYTLRRQVKKPAGAKPGFVIYEKQKTLWVTTDEASVNAILQEAVRMSVPE